MYISHTRALQFIENFWKKKITELACTEFGNENKKTCIGNRNPSI